MGRVVNGMGIANSTNSPKTDPDIEAVAKESNGLDGGSQIVQKMSKAASSGSNPRSAINRAIYIDSDSESDFSVLSLHTDSPMDFSGTIKDIACSSDNSISCKNNHNQSPAKSTTNSSMQSSQNDSRNKDDNLIVNVETQEFKDEILKINDIVYAPYPGQNPKEEAYYWGKIETIKDGDACKNFSIRFWDGDMTESITSFHINRYQEATKLMKQGFLENDPPPKDYSKEISKQEKRSKSSVLHINKPDHASYLNRLRELMKTRCSKCPSCTRKSCGNCDACIKDERRCCFLRICCNIAPTEKALPAAYFLQGYHFYFDEEFVSKVSALSEAHKKLNGLILVGPSGKKFYSVESCMNSSSKLAKLDPPPTKFYEFAGIELTIDERRVLQQKYSERDIAYKANFTSARSEKEKSPSKYKRATTPEDCRPSLDLMQNLAERNCSDCAACSREACRKCDFCSRELGDLCFRRICENIPVSEKKLPAAYFPEGFSFYFDTETVNKYIHKTPAHDKLDGLIILGPTGRKYYSVESLLNSVKTFNLLPTSPRKFYEYVGLKFAKDDEESLYTNKNIAKSSHSPQAPEALTVAESRADYEIFEKLAVCGRCAACPSCTRDACGKCDSCIQSQGMYCLRRICCKISPIKKALRAAYFPSGFSFYFDKMLLRNIGNLSEGHTKLDGFTLISPSGKKFYSIESAMHSLKVLRQLVPSPTKFYEYAGIELSEDDKGFLQQKYSERRRRSVESQITNSTPANGSLIKLSSEEQSDAQTSLEPADCRNKYKSVQEQVLLRCSDCPSCTRDVCGRCDSCTRGEGGFCLRRICCRLPVEKKALPAAFFPPGFSFCFDASLTKKKSLNPAQLYEKLDGLIIFKQSDKKFYSVESVLNKIKSLKKLDPSPTNFYEHVGIELTDEDRSFLQTQKRKQNKCMNHYSNEFHPPKRLKTNAGSQGEISTWNMAPIAYSLPEEEIQHSDIKKYVTPTQLYQNRCRNCVLCLKEDCGKCETCVNNTSQSRRFKEACLRKMCEKIDEVDKLQPAKGFPAGWTFYFDRDERNTGLKVREERLGVYLVSPASKKYRTATLAINDNDLGHDRTRRYLFYKQIGASPLERVVDHPLLNEPYSIEWINAHGERLSLHGKVSFIENNILEGGLHFTITYSVASRDFVNSYYKGYGAIAIPPAEKLNELSAWGGCLMYQSKHRQKKKPLNLSNRIRFPRKWLVPDLYRNISIQCQDKSNKSLPCVIIHYACFELRFVVKTSTIPNAGYGVFLSCQPLDDEDSQRYFELLPGELLDFGVYAPLRAEDRKNEHRFLIKSFIHKFKCESYVFDTRDHDDAYDITDDLTGTMHSEARKHIPPYVNETNEWRHRIPEVQAMYDPQGSLHYLLGYLETESKSFKVPADGIEREIFIDYGEAYELVRLREGFPRSDMEPSAIKEKLEKDEFEYLEEILSFSANETKGAISLLKNIITKEIKEEDMIKRMLLVLIFLRKRAVGIRKEFAQPIEDDESFCDNGVTEIDLEELVVSCSELALKCCILMESKDNLQHEMLSQPLFSKALSAVFPQKELAHRLMSNYKNPFHEMSPSEFRDLICNTTDYFFPREDEGNDPESLNCE